jgi:hypothetical protein
MNISHIPRLVHTIPEIADHLTPTISNSLAGNVARSKHGQILYRGKTFLLIIPLVVGLLAFQLFYFRGLERQLENLEHQVETLLNQPPSQANIPPHYHEEFKGKDFLLPFGEVEEIEPDDLTL